MNIVFASSKGGVGKSTSCAALAALLADPDRQDPVPQPRSDPTSKSTPHPAVIVLDLDQNRSLDVWARSGGAGPGTALPGLEVEAVAADDFAARARAAAARAPHVFVDLPGLREVTLMKAIAKADLVIIPAQHSEPDIRQAMTIAGDIADIEETLGRPVAHGVLFTKVRPLRTRLDRFVEEEVARAGIPRFETALVDRIAYKEMFLNGVAPHRKEPDRGAGPELAALLAEIETILGGGEEAAEAPLGAGVREGA